MQPRRARCGQLGFSDALGSTNEVSDDSFLQHKVEAYVPRRRRNLRPLRAAEVCAANRHTADVLF